MGSIKKKVANKVLTLRHPGGIVSTHFRELAKKRNKARLNQQ